MRFRSYIDGGERFMAPETSMEVQAALGSDIALAFDECTPFHVDRDYTERSTERTHRWLERCLRLAGRARAATIRSSTRSSQGGVYEDMRRGSTRVVAQSRAPGVAIGGSLGADKAQMYEVVDWATDELELVAPDEAAPPARDRRHRRPRARRRAGDRHVRLRDADAARPPRDGDRARARAALARRPDEGPLEARPRADHGRTARARRARAATRAPTCTTCSRARELTALRLVTLHNLAFIARLMADLRAAIAAGTLAEVAAAVRGGAAPGGLA